MSSSSYPIPQPNLPPSPLPGQLPMASPGGVTPSSSAWRRLFKPGFAWRLPGILIWMVAAFVLAANLTSNGATYAAMAGVLAAFLGAELLDGLQVRLQRLWLVALAAISGVAGLSSLLRFTTLPAEVASPLVVYSLTESTLWFTGMVAFLLPTLVSAKRYSLFLTVEAFALVTIFASWLAAHREGAVHRPFFITDFLLERNWDPMPFFLGFGAALGVLLVIWMMSRSSAKRTLVDPVILISVVLALFLFLPYQQIRKMANWAASGPGGDKQEQQGQGGGKGDKQDDQPQGQTRDPNPTNSSRGKPQPVAVVNLHDDYTPPYGVFYFRQDTLSNWNGRRLVRDASGKLDNDVGMPFPAAPIEVPLRDRADEESQGGRPAAHRLLSTVALMVPHSKPFGLIDVARLDPAPNPDPKRFERAYQVESIVLDTDFANLLDRKLGSPKWSAETWKHYTDAPEDPRYRTITEQAKALLPPHMQKNPVAQALAIKIWLDKSTVYNLQVPKPDEDADPVADFLFGNRNGYCVHLAHSAVNLMRTVGIPARVSLGYAVNARQRGNGSTILIRGGDAHAWPEVYVGGLGWVVLDIAPEKVATPPQEENVDQEQQRMLGEMARKTPTHPNQKNPPPGDGDVRRALLEGLLALARMLLPAMVFTVGALYTMKVWRRVEPRFCSEARLPAAVYRATLDQLADIGFKRASGQTRESFASSVANRAPEFAQLTRHHLQAAFGQSLPKVSRQDYFALQQRVAAQAGRTVAWWRRALGFVNPLSWWNVK